MSKWKKPCGVLVHLSSMIKKETPVERFSSSGLNVFTTFDQWLMDRLRCGGVTCFILCNIPGICVSIFRLYIKGTHMLNTIPPLMRRMREGLKWAAGACASTLSPLRSIHVSNIKPYLNCSFFLTLLDLQSLNASRQKKTVQLHSNNTWPYQVSLGLKLYNTLFQSVWENIWWENHSLFQHPVILISAGSRAIEKASSEGFISQDNLSVIWKSLVS